MDFIKTRKKIVSSAIVTSLTAISGHTIAQDQVMNRTGFVGDFLFKLGHLT